MGLGGIEEEREAEMDEEDKRDWPLLQAWAIIREDPVAKRLREMNKSGMVRSSGAIIACPLHVERLRMLEEQVLKSDDPYDARIDVDVIDESAACFQCRLLLALVTDDPWLLRHDLGNTPEEIKQKALECFEGYKKKYGGGGTE